MEVHHHDVAGAFALSSAICCHLLSKHHHHVTEGWLTNKWFWAGLFGNIPAVIGLGLHLLILRTDEVVEG